MSADSVSVKTQTPILLFSLYAPEDARLYKEFEKHLSALTFQYFISMRSVGTIYAGSDREAEIEKYLNEAHIVLFFISSHFMGSPYCHIVENALKRQTEVPQRFLPINLRPVDVGKLKLSKLQALPSSGRSITKWPNKDEAFSHIAEKIRLIVEEQIDPPTKNIIITENHLSYLNWLIKRVSDLDIWGTHLNQGLLQVKLEDVYLPLEVEKDEKILRNQTANGEEQADDNPPLLLSEVVLRHSHLLLLGEPGSGKTTSLRYLALKYAQELCHSAGTNTSETRFPILLRVADYVEYGMREGKSLDQYLADDCIRHECNVPELADMLNAELQAGRCLVLFDGLDEVVHSVDQQAVVRRLEEFIHLHENRSNRFILTSRRGTYGEAPLSETFARYSLRKLEEPHIQRFLEKWYRTVEATLFPEEAKTIGSIQTKQEIDGTIKAIQTLPALYQLATNPLSLRLLAQLYQVDVPLPRQRAALYDQIIKAFIQTWRLSQGVSAEELSKASSRFDQSSITHVLSGLGYWLHTQKPGGIASESEIYSELRRIWSSFTNRPGYEENPDIEKEMRQFLQVILIHTGILVEDSPGHYRFAHLTFEEYFVACYLVENSQERAKRIRAHLHDPYWQEPILLALGLIGMEAPEEAHRLVEVALLAEGDKANAEGIVSSAYEDLLGRDFLFALRCLGDNIPVHPALAERLIERLYRELVHHTDSGRFWTYQEALVERLRDVETSDYASLLLPYLIKNLESTDSGLRVWSLYGIGRIGRASLQEKEKACQLLLEALHDEDPRIRSASLWGLSHMFGSEITDAFLAILRNDPDFSVREKALQYLMERGESSSQLTEALLHVLHEEATGLHNFQLRNAAVVALGQQGDASLKVISVLIELLHLDNAQQHHPDSRVLEVLRQLSQVSAEVVPMLVSALQDATLHTRIVVAQAMETFGYASQNALEVLLLYRLHVPDYSVRLSTVQMLGQLEEISERAEEALQEYLYDEDERVCFLAVEILCTFEMSSKTFSIFRTILSSDTNTRMRACIVEHLGDVDWPLEDILQVLLKAMHDTDDHVRLCAVKSLGYRAPTISKVLTALLFALRHDASVSVRLEVVRCLQSLSEFPKRALPTIVQALADENPLVRQDCAQLLGQNSTGNKQSIQALLKGLSDTDMSVRKACSQALVLLGQRFPQSKETIMRQLARMVKGLQKDAIFYGAPGNIAYETLWLLFGC